MKIVSEKQYIDGSASRKSYLVVARRGNVVLGLKAEGIRDAKAGFAELFVRLRSIEAGDAVKDAVKESKDNVTALPAVHTNVSAWPEIAFDAVSEDRASAVLSCFLRGSIKDDPWALAGGLAGPRVFDQLAAFIRRKAGRENMVLPPGEIAGHLRERFGTAVDAVVKAFEARGKIARYAEDHVGIFDFQKAMLAKIFGQTGQEAQAGPETGTGGETIGD